MKHGMKGWQKYLCPVLRNSHFYHHSDIMLRHTTSRATVNTRPLTLLFHLDSTHRPQSLCLMVVIRLTKADLLYPLFQAGLVVKNINSSIHSEGN